MELFNNSTFRRTVADLAVTCQLFVDGQPLCQPVRTAHKAFVDKWRYALYAARPGSAFAWFGNNNQKLHIIMFFALFLASHFAPFRLEQAALP
jgi:hypothetical protein